MLRRSSLLVLALALVTAACGNDENDVATTPDAPGSNSAADTVTATSSVTAAEPVLETTAAAEPVPATTPTAPPDPSLISVEVPSATAPSELTDPIAAASAFEDNDLAAVMNAFEMVVPKVPVVIPAGGSLIDARSAVSTTNRLDELGFVFADDGTGDATVDALVAEADPLGDFESPEVTRDELLGVTRYKVNLLTSDHRGLQFGFKAETSPEFEGVTIITVTRSISLTEADPPTRPAFATDATADAEAVAATAKVTKLDGWTVQVGSELDPVQAMRSYELTWESTGLDLTTLGTEICTSSGLDIMEQEDAIRCENWTTGTTWDFLDPNIGEPTVLVRYGLSLRGEAAMP